MDVGEGREQDTEALPSKYLSMQSLPDGRLDAPKYAVIVE